MFRLICDFKLNRLLYHKDRIYVNKLFVFLRQRSCSTGGVHIRYTLFKCLLVTLGLPPHLNSFGRQF
jgi:hypothetical protein